MLLEPRKFWHWQRGLLREGRPESHALSPTSARLVHLKDYKEFPVTLRTDPMVIELLTATLVLITGLYAWVTFRILGANEKAVT